jgi:hypothetical protein
MLCISKRSICLILVTIFFLFSGYTKGDAIEQLTASKITRISHPVYRAGNLWYGVRDPWNRDYTRIMLYENTSYTDPSTGKKGRGMAWGFINNLKNWTTLAEYESAAKPLPNNSYWVSTSLYWSPFSGEENIIYGIYTADKTVSKLNVDTGVRTPIVSYDPGDGADISQARSFGWTANNTLIVNFKNEDWSSGGFEIDVKTTTRTRYANQPNDCSAEGNRWPQRGHAHGHRSPDKAIKAEYGSGLSNTGVRVQLSGVDCNTLYLDNVAPTTTPNEDHVSWRYSNDWYIVGSVGLYSGGNFTSPHLDTYTINQVFFDRVTHHFEYNVLVSKAGAGLWYVLSTQTMYNWHSLPIPTLRSDGKQIFFMSTDGKYSYDDYIEKGKTPWGTEGFFLADLSSASPTIPTRPASPEWENK